MSGRVVEVCQPDRRPLFVVVEDDLDVGRECDGLLLADSEVSRRHARLSAAGDAIQVTDLGSTNGTLVNGTRIAGPTLIWTGDTVTVGTTTLRLTGRRALETPAGAPPVPSLAGQVDPRATVVHGRPVVAAPIGAQDARTTSILRVAASVQDDGPPTRAQHPDGDTLTIVFSDIESSTEQALRLGDDAWFAVLATHNRIVRSNLRAFGGTEIKSQGDGFMLTFTSARRAVQFCSAVQQELAAWGRKEPDQAVRIRMGAHTGEAIVDDDGDLFGRHIIVAARIANLADGGEVLVSQVVRDITASRGDLRFSEARPVTLKGIEGEHQVFAVDWAD